MFDDVSTRNRGFERLNLGFVPGLGPEPTQLHRSVALFFTARRGILLERRSPALLAF
jgi:hypothetical protein